MPALRLLLQHGLSPHDLIWCIGGGFALAGLISGVLWLAGRLLPETCSPVASSGDVDSGPY
jgi:hypothetical protein